MANKPLKSIKFPGLADTYTVPEIDNTLTTSGKAADSKKVGDELNDLKSAVTALEHVISQEDLTYAQISEIVKAGRADKYFKIGDQIMVKWNDGTNEHELPWDIVHFGDVELQGGDIVPGMFIQSHYAMQDVQFDASEAIYVASAALPAGTYNFTIGTTWGTHCVAGTVYQFTTTVEIPAGGQIMVSKNNDFWTWGAPDTAPSNWKVHTFASNAATTPLESNLALTEGSGGTALGSLASNVKYSSSGINNLQRAAYGYNRWAQSANRKYYNSAAASGAWWSPENPFDRAPQQLTTVRGFMAGFEEAFLDIINPVKVVTALNTVSDSDIGTTETTYDTFFLPSLEQEYIVPQLSGAEGAYWEYWKQRLDLSTPQAQGSAGVNPAHIRYAFDARTTAQYCRLRSARRGGASLVWFVATTGYAGTYYAALALRGCPACVIC